MFTVLFTMLGIGVFIFSLFTVGFKMAFVRLLLCTAVGLVIDLTFGLALVGLAGFTY